LDLCEPVHVRELGGGRCSRTHCHGDGDIVWKLF